MIRFENKENGRFYYMVVENDDSNRLILRIIRGGKRVRVVRSVSYDCSLDVRKEINRLSKRRIRHGYTLMQHDYDGLGIGTNS